MRTFFYYLQPAKATNATTAVIYHFNFTNRIPVYNCYYNHYDPEKGYIAPYHQRAFISCSQKTNIILFQFPEGNKY
jgi:hypothetical protein